MLELLYVCVYVCVCVCVQVYMFVWISGILWVSSSTALHHIGTEAGSFAELGVLHFR